MITDAFTACTAQAGAVWIPDRGVIASGGKQLFNVAGAAPLLTDLERGVSYCDADVASNQSCLRMSSWEEIGTSTKSHVFFTMMGHFSFYRHSPDEAKEWAILMAFDFLRRELQLPIENLVVSVHPEESGSRQIWEKLGIRSFAEIREGHDANFIPGQGGYRTKIGWRYPSGEVMRFWDIVFVEYDKTTGKTLDTILVDSGMALERLLMAVEGVNSSYETSRWQSYVKELAEATSGTLRLPQLRRLADVTRATSVLCLTGVQPGPKKHEYVLRKLAREGMKILLASGHIEAYGRVITALVEDGLRVYPAQLHQRPVGTVEETLQGEYEVFLARLEQARRMKEKLQQKSGGTLSATDERLLQESFGFSSDLLV